MTAIIVRQPPIHEVIVAMLMLPLIVWERPNYYSSPAISRSLDAGLDVSGLTKNDIDLFDFYSSVSQIME